MTANAFDEDRRNALECGMNGFLSKPIVIADLCAGDAQGPVTRGVSEPGIIRKAKTKDAATLFYSKIAWLRFLWVSLLAENEICRGAFYMRPRRFILLDRWYGRIWNPPLRFEAAAHRDRGQVPREAEFSPLSET